MAYTYRLFITSRALKLVFHRPNLEFVAMLWEHLSEQGRIRALIGFQSI